MSVSLRSFFLVYLVYIGIISVVPVGHSYERFIVSHGPEMVAEFSQMHSVYFPAIEDRDLSRAGVDPQSGVVLSLTSLHVNFHESGSLNF